ncbi:hypothetical protein AB3S75_026583 [Citrus x aurantiifolia]
MLKMGKTNEKCLFSKTLTKTDINNKFSVKSKSLPSFPPFGAQTYAQDFNAEDEEGKKWLFRLIIRKGKHKKPVISAGWRSFVRQKKLKIDDKVLFFKEQNEAEIATGGKYKIKVQKSVKVFKAIIGYVPCMG